MNDIFLPARHGDMFQRLASLMRAAQDRATLDRMHQDAQGTTIIIEIAPAIHCDEHGLYIDSTLSEVQQHDQ